MDGFIYYENKCYKFSCTLSILRTYIQFGVSILMILYFSRHKQKGSFGCFFFSSSDNMVDNYFWNWTVTIVYIKICDAKAMKVVLYFCHWLTVSKNFWFKSHWWLIDWAFIVYLFKSWNKNWCFFYLDWLLGVGTIPLPNFSFHLENWLTFIQ